MKVVFITIVVLFAPSLLRGQQSIAPSVNNLAGLDVKLSDAFIATSIGEPAITTLGTTQGFITQGFLQPELLPCADLELKYYPNPTKDIVTVEVRGCDAGIASIEILDMWGQILTTVIPTEDHKVNLGDLAQGVYLIKVRLTNDDVHAISVVKKSN